MRSYDELTEELKNRNIRLSHQRLKILEYLSNNLIHPTADQVYNGLHKEIPTLSKTTVYSTLGTLAKAGMVRVINIEDLEVRYDINVENHGHFKCEQCGKVYDFDVNIDGLKTDALKNFNIRDKNIYFKGTCPACQANRN